MARLVAFAVRLAQLKSVQDCNMLDRTTWARIWLGLRLQSQTRTAHNTLFRSSLHSRLGARSREKSAIRQNPSELTGEIPAAVSFFSLVRISE